MRADQGDQIERILGATRRIAVVGLSPDPTRDSHDVARALQRRGFEVVPVNPMVDEVLGLRSYASLDEVPGHVDLVNVFRRAEHLPGVAREAAAIGAPALWNQLGLRSAAARETAEAAGMAYVEDACIKVEVARRDARPAGARADHQ